MTDSVLRELADLLQADDDDDRVRLRKGVMDTTTPPRAFIAGATTSVPVQPVNTVPAAGAVVWILESGPRRVLLG